MVLRARMVEKTAEARLVPTDNAGLPRLWAAALRRGAFFCTQVRRWRRWRVWASQPCPFWTWSTMVGRLPATWVRVFTRG